MAKQGVFITSVLLSLALALLLSGCEKEEVETPVQYGDITSIVGRQSKTINFFNNYSDIPADLFPTLEFHDNCFNEDTRISIEYIELFGSKLPDSLVTVTSDCRYLWYFDAKEKDLQQPVQVTIPYPADLQEKLLDRYEYLFRLYRRPKGPLTSKIENLEPVGDYTLDTAANQVRFTVEDFEYGYAILFRELKMHDHVIIHAQDPILMLFENNTIIQHFISDRPYFSIENWYGKGFHVVDDTSFYVTYGAWGNVSELEFSFAGTAPGIYSGDQVSLRYETVYSTKYLYTFTATPWTIINVTKYGGLGEFIEGTVTGYLYETDFGKYVEFYIWFKVRRLR